MFPRENIIEDIPFELNAIKLKDIQKQANDLIFIYSFRIWQIMEILKLIFLTDLQICHKFTLIMDFFSYRQLPEIQNVSVLPTRLDLFNLWFIN